MDRGIQSGQWILVAEGVFFFIVPKASTALLMLDGPWATSNPSLLQSVCREARVYKPLRV